MITFVLLLRHLIETALKKVQKTSNLWHAQCRQCRNKYCQNMAFFVALLGLQDIVVESREQTAVFFLSYGGFSKNTTQKKGADYEKMKHMFE